jgi:CrcB protein
MIALMVAIGGALGSLARYFLAEAVAASLGSTFPYGTLFVNVTGSFVIGLLAGGSWDQVKLTETLFVRYFLMLGICGGYTTFSSFSLQTVLLLQAGEGLRAILNVTFSVLTCLLATWAGFAIAGALAR